MAFQHRMQLQVLQPPQLDASIAPTTRQQGHALNHREGTDPVLVGVIDRMEEFALVQTPVLNGAIP
eukprot:CAMPEP_0181233660 /NCGR_PEP_ID=MMETSP1096-20121128/36473_1 /TAXON_ID=156174 ORGANISM="Chrysochromulina ericina, Strain CCMP281" /NCGR_SAMPLE_ID=MMETSP1096 /ASSEMBLY_ACC=CAM_ASM_000453 /LENGTH=65 /DNA_ID=CAMNT_0023328213 /DNA_START=704 /DNA_END=901 /DNA_ORIENTATION=+